MAQSSYGSIGLGSDPAGIPRDDAPPSTPPPGPEIHPGGPIAREDRVSLLRRPGQPGPRQERVRLAPIKATTVFVALGTALVAALMLQSYSPRNPSPSSLPVLTLRHDAVSPDFCDPSSPLSLSGFFGLDGSRYDPGRSKRYYYWFFERRSRGLSGGTVGRDEDEDDDDAAAPLILWMNGGPGCSSMLGLVSELGPCLVNEDGESTRVNPYSWTEVGHVLFLDQPAGVGYSTGELNDDNVEMVAEDVYYFLRSFFASDEGSAYAGSPLYLAGESYAGHYTPAIAHRILNDDGVGGGSDMNLAGVAIGNGFFSAAIQWNWYAPMAYQFKEAYGVEVLTKEEYDVMTEGAEVCVKLAEDCNEDAAKCEPISNSTCWGPTFFGVFGDQNRSVYDMTQQCTAANSCVDSPNIEEFLNLNSTKRALHVPLDEVWTECSREVNRRWSERDFLASTMPYLEEVLGSNLPVLLYAGDYDYICNYLGVLAVARALDWEHAADFDAAEDHDWEDGRGEARSAGKLSFLRIYRAGHMVPTDQPVSSLKMIDQFLAGKPF